MNNCTYILDEYCQTKASNQKKPRHNNCRVDTLLIKMINLIGII